MEIDPKNTLQLVGGITALAGMVYSLMKILRENKKSKKFESDAILEEAREMDTAIRIKLESKIEVLTANLESLKASVNKDIEHVKETQTNELKNLSDRIESLRSEIVSYHSQLVTLLTTLVNKN